MSLATLLIRIIVVLFLIAAGLLFALEMTTLRQSIIEQMAANLETAITALGLVLQGTLLNDDKVLAETIVNAMFDGGFVSSVTLLDPDGQLLFQKSFHSVQQHVPSWLPALIDMPLVKVEQELTDGWRILGTLTLEGHSGYAYQHLWNAISRMGLALLAVLIILTLIITWVCKRVLHPLELINLQLVQIRKRQFNGVLTSPWLSDLKEVTRSINQLVSERKRDLLQQRLKITQLGKQFAPMTLQPLQGVSPLPTGGQQQQFVSTQGDVTLYRRFLPGPLLDVNSDLATITTALTQWQLSTLEGISLPLSLLHHLQWPHIASLLRQGRGKILDLRWNVSVFPAHAQAALTALQAQGVELAFSTIPCTTDVFNQLDSLNPIFISAQLTDAPLYWNLLAQTMHASGYTLLIEAGTSQDIDTLRHWGIDGYAKGVHL
ncbi:MAG: LapD/MoxY N-terminal periplasmic domain-containing protein [Aeromonas sp.]